jgi:NAD(P)-dependent dehydrogenase (short-subunit alcohol dehydrogenase family)
MPLQQHPLASPFDASSAADAVVRHIDLAQRRVIVTGASAGIGAETARVLAGAGAHVILAVRSLSKGREVAAEISRSTGSDRVSVGHLDLADFASVRAFARQFLERSEPLHLLVNNAGIMPAKLTFVAGGIETQFAVNHLGHMLLACLLAPALLEGAPARLVVVSSAAHRRVAAHFDDVNFDQRPYDKLEAYSLSKSANALFALEFNRRLEDRGVTAYSVNPGPVFTGLQAAFSPDEMKSLQFHDTEGNPADWFKSVGQGAATSVWCATSPLLSAGGGVYCENCNVAEVVEAMSTQPGGRRSQASGPGRSIRSSRWICGDCPSRCSKSRSISTEPRGQAFRVERASGRHGLSGSRGHAADRTSQARRSPDDSADLMPPGTPISSSRDLRRCATAWVSPTVCA